MMMTTPFYSFIYQVSLKRVDNCHRLFTYPFTLVGTRTCVCAMHIQFTYTATLYAFNVIKSGDFVP